MQKQQYVNLEKLYIELDLMDNTLDFLKQDRVQKMQLKELELDELFSDSLEDENTRLKMANILENYKEQLSEDLGINDLRKERQLIKNKIDEIDKQLDSETNINYM